MFLDKRYLFRALMTVACALASITAVAGPGNNAQPDVLTNPEVTPAVQHDYLPSLRGIMTRPDNFTHGNRVAPFHGIPAIDSPGNPPDGAVQSAPGGPAAPVLGSGVDGVGDGFSGPSGAFTVQYAPPDTVGAVGDTQYVQVVNVGYAVFDKTTKGVLFGPVPTKNLWAGFGGPCEADNDGDAVVVYDKAAHRWVVSQFAVTAAPYYQCVAVSTTQDATGGFNRYAFSYGSVFPDYPKIGVWPDGYYISFNMFNGNTFAGAKVCAYDRNAMLAGQPATQQCFQLSTSYGGLLPSDLDGATAPPAGSPNFFLNRGASTLNLWRFHTDWANSANTTLTGPINIPVAAFTAACNGGTCVPQAGTGQKLDSLADRLMYRLAYRNFVSYEALTVTHSVKLGGSSPKSQYSGVRWYELRHPNGTPVVYQQSTYAPDANFRWMGSMAQDKQGNMALGYSVSSAGMHPAIRYTGRLATDTLSTMQAETSIIEGNGSQLANLSRWGDYAGMTVDPVDDCTFWFTTEYLKTNGTFNWSTRIASFKFPGCV